MNEKSTTVVGGILVALLVFNQLQMVSLQKMMMGTDSIMGTGTPAASDGGVDLSSLAAQLIPTGAPEAYGKELGVSFDDPASAIALLQPYEQDSRVKKLSGVMLERYIRLGSEPMNGTPALACEFCCGATTLVFPDGSMACACGHSAAMRGVMAYLIENTDMTDQQIYEEVSTWKAAFFPGPTVKKYAQANGLVAAPSQLQDQVGGC